MKATRHARGWFIFCVMLLCVTLVATGCGNSGNSGSAGNGGNGGSVSNGGNAGNGGSNGQTNDGGEQASGEGEELPGEAGYPTKPINIIVGKSPGGSTDLLARAMAKASDKYLGQPMVVLNKPGASGNLAFNETGDAAPDGYTVGSASNSLVSAPLLGETKYNYATDLEAIAMIGSSPYILAVNSESEWQTLEQFVEYAKANPSKIKYGHTGVGSGAHIATEQFALLADIKIEPVSFDGGSPLILALLGSHIDAIMSNPLDIQEQVKAGAIRVLASAGEARIDDPLYVDVPTFTEKNYDLVSIVWQGFAAPKGIPAGTLKTLRDGFEQMANDPETVEVIKQMGFIPHYMNGEEFGAFWLEEQEVLKQTLEATGILQMIQDQKK